jgi:hypothetical protein
MTKRTKAQAFPCYLGDIRTPLDNGPRCHLIAEARGLRYYLGTYATIAEAEADARSMQLAGKGIGAYIVDRSANHFISDGRKAFDAAFNAVPT